MSNEETVREEEKEEMNDEETVGEEEKEEVSNEETVREEEKEEVNDGTDVGKGMVVGNVVIEGVPVAFSTDVDGDTMEEEVLNDGEGVEGAVVVLTTNVDIVIIALVVTSTVEEILLVILALLVISTVEETILAVVSPMDDVLIDIVDITVLVPVTGGVVVIEVVNIEELSPDSISSPLPLALP